MIGLNKICIPLKKDELTKENIEKFNCLIFQKFWENKIKIRKDYEEYKGKHDIINKIRQHETENDINNKISLPNLWDIVNFKVGYVVGVPIEYTKKEDVTSDDITYLKTYRNDQNLDKKDSEATEWAYASGVGYYFIQPKVVDDLKSNAPFDIFVLEPDTCFKVYSSYIGNEPLFDVIVTKIEESNGAITKYICSIYTEDMYYEYSTDEFGNVFSYIKNQKREGYKLLPLVERYANKDHVSLVTLGRDCQNALDRISSDEIDNIQEKANELLIIKNCMLGESEEEKREILFSARRNGVLEIQDKTEKLPANVDTLSTKLVHNDIYVLKDEIKKELYECLGVPLTDANGYNNTGSSQEKGLGWDKAYAVILKEKNNFLNSDRELLERIIWICNNTPDCPVNNIKSSQIDIKYNIARGNNLMTKTQSLAYLLDRNVPPDIAWQTCELSGDSTEIGKQIDERKEKAITQEQTTQSCNSSAMASMENYNTSEQTQGGISEPKKLD